MSTFRFVHAADIHLDSPLKGLENYSEDPNDPRIARIRSATRAALRSLVDLCIDSQVDFLVISGDLYDGAWKSTNTGHFFAKEISRLTQRDKPIPVYVIKGNHDAESVLIKDLKLPHLHLLGHRGPESRSVEGTTAVIHGQSFATKHVEEDLSRNYPPPVPGHFNIGLLHTSATGRPGHDRYAPCDPHDLARRGYDYWALGHVHKREVLCEDPYILFPGNIQGRHIEEACTTGKGCTLVEVKHGKISCVTPHVLDTVRWLRLEVDVTGAAHVDEIRSMVEQKLRHVADTAGSRLVACRLTIAGRTDASAELVHQGTSFIEDLRLSSSGLQRGDVWLEKIKIETMPGHDFSQAVESDGFEGELLRFLERARQDDGLLRHIAGDLIEVSEKILADFPQGDRTGVSLDSLREILPKVQQLLFTAIRRK